MVEVKQGTKYVKETENVAEKYSAMTVSKNSSDVNMNVGEMPSAAFTAVPTLKSVKKVRTRRPAIARLATEEGGGAPHYESWGPVWGGGGGRPYYWPGWYCRSSVK